MREYIDLNFLVNLVSMLRADVDGALWLADDEEEARFYERCAHSTARVVAAPNAAVRLLGAVADRGIEGVVATVHGAETPECARGDVFRPSLGDVASLLLTSGGFERAFLDICGGPWVTACMKQVGPILHRAIWITRIFGRFYEACRAVEPTRLDPSDLLLVEGILWETLEPDWGRIHSLVSDWGLSSTALEQLHALSCGDDLNTGIVECDGMDAVEVLAAATRFFRPRGIRPLREIEAHDLMAMLRMSFDLEELEADEMFWRMRRWERHHPRYPLLRSWRILDPLGTVWDQRYWEKDLGCILRFLQPTESLAALQMDLDNFKHVNEVLGHSSGDDAIRLFCSTARGLLRGVGEVYRRGGDELVAFAPGLDVAAAQNIAEKVRDEVEAKFREWGNGRGLQSFPTASIGLVLTDRTCAVSRIAQLMEVAQHRAKEQGKNRVVCLQEAM